MQKSFLLIALFSCTLTVYGQTAKLPAMADWFLPTGAWNKDPEIYIREFGTGKDTVVFLHGGWGGDHEGLLNAVQGLGKQFHFIFYDQRGSLRSPFPDSLITYDAHVEDLEHLRKELRLSKIKLAGHSMGSILASAYATKYPNRIKSLILLSPADLKNPLPPEDQPVRQKQNEEFNTFMNRPEAAREFDKYGLQRPDQELSGQELTARFRINFSRRMLYDVTKWPTLTGGRALYKGNVFNLTAQSYPKQGWDFIAELQGQSFPVRIISGDHDFIDFNNVLTKKWIQGKKQFTFTPIPKAGHLLWIDQPEVFTKEFGKALAN